MTECEKICDDNYYIPERQNSFNNCIDLCNEDETYDEET